MLATGVFFLTIIFSFVTLVCALPCPMRNRNELMLCAASSECSPHAKQHPPMKMIFRSRAFKETEGTMHPMLVLLQTRAAHDHQRSPSYSLVQHARDDIRNAKLSTYWKQCQNLKLLVFLCAVVRIVPAGEQTLSLSFYFYHTFQNSQTRIHVYLNLRIVFPPSLRRSTAKPMLFERSNTYMRWR